MAATTLQSAALALMLSSASSQSVIFIPSFLSTTSTGEPPCRQRRLEPFRQSIRNSCSIESRQCSAPSVAGDKHDSVEDVFMFPPPVRSMFEGINFNSMQPVVEQQSMDVYFDRVFEDMMGQSLRMFDALLATDGSSFNGSSDTSVDREEYETEGEGDVDSTNANEAGSADSDVPDTKQQQAEQAAEQALDVMVASLFSRLADTNNNDQEITSRLEEKGHQIMADTHRRLSESNDVDPHTSLQQRLARRLTEYSMDLFYHPDGTVTLYTASIPQKETTPILGLGSQHLDSCVYSKYTNGDLNNSCHEAMESFLYARDVPGLTYSQFHSMHSNKSTELQQDRVLDQQTIDSIMKTLDERTHHHGNEPANSDLISDYYAPLIILFSIYGFIAIVGFCSGVVDCWTFIVGVVASVLVAMVGMWSLFVLLPVVFLVDRLCVDHEEEEEENEYDYVKLISEDGNGSVKQAETVVFVGVPVQIV